MLNENKINEFLRKYNQHPDNIDIDEVTKSMLMEMSLGLQGKESSLMMIPTYLSTSNQLPLNTPVIVIDAGGTNLRIAAVEFTEEKLEVLKFEKRAMLGTKEVLNSEQFISKLIDLLIPYLTYSNKIGFCFSFPAEILPNKDGKVIGFCKEVNITGCEGLVLGEAMNNELAKRNINTKLEVVVLNDTVATLLGGPTVKKGQEIDGQIGLILGTGTNCAYTEKTVNITKAREYNNSTMIINTESGMFDKVDRGYFDKYVDQHSQNPNDHVFEKMISGVYLGNVIAQTIKQAVKENIFTGNNTILDLGDFTMVEVDSFLRRPFGDNLLANSVNSLEDKETLYQFINSALNRSSKLVTANLAANILKAEGGSSLCKPVRIMIEGSTYHKCYSYKERINRYMLSYISEQLNKSYLIVNDSDANLVGSAVAALMNL